MSAKTLPLVGAHISIAGGLRNAVHSAVKLGCDCFQIFARNPRGWLARPLSRPEIREFRAAREAVELWPLAIHSVYLINLAAQDPILLGRSREAFREEIKRAIDLGADYLVVHPGSAGTAPVEVAIATAVESVHRATRGLKLRGASQQATRGLHQGGLAILIENTAGQGASIGSTFDQIAALLWQLNDLPVDVCLDTAHTFTAGYDISSKTGLMSTIAAIEGSFGFDRIKVIHCNDSRAPLGSRVDRHQHIGLGHIGAEALCRLAHDPRFRRVPFILETPVDRDRNYEWNLHRLREIASSRDCRRLIQSS